MKKAKKEIFFMSHEINKDKQTDRGLENQGTEKSTKITAVLSGSSKFYLILTQHHPIFPIPLKQLSYIKIFPFYYTVDLSRQMLSMEIVMYNDTVLCI